MTVQTPWGYTVEQLPAIMTPEQLRALMPTLSSTDATLAAVIDGVSSAVRDWCGWHVSPVLECTYTGNGEGQLLMLPAMGVQSFDALSIDGAEVDASAYWWDASGMVRLKHSAFPRGWRNVQAVYTAGFASASVAQVVAQIAANMLTASPGVREEHAGQVGITYNQTGSGITGGVSLLERDRAMLAPYRLARAW